MLTTTCALGVHLETSFFSFFNMKSSLFPFTQACMLLDYMLFSVSLVYVNTAFNFL